MARFFPVLTLVITTLVLSVSQADACSRCGNPNCLGNGMYIQSGFQSYPPQNIEFVSPNQLIGFDQFTGAPITGNTQINSSVLTPGRTESMYNGSMRPVNRPVYDNFGNVVGYQQGVEWNNSFTGQLHWQTDTITQNNLGGAHIETSFRGRPSTGTSMHIQQGFGSSNGGRR
jgi:hypothetical protein